MGLACGNGGTIVTESPAHPLDPLTASEIRQATAILRRDRGVGAGWRFASIELREPVKGAPEPVRREAIVVCWDRSDGQAYRAVVTLAEDAVASWEHLPGQQPNMTVDEWHECDQMLRAHPALAEALARRGITDLSLVLTDMWAYGAALVPERYRGLRIGWSDVWYRDSPDANPYAHHVTGLHPVVDLNRMTLLEIEDVWDGGAQPSVRGEYAPALLGRPLREVAPLRVSQPSGVGFTLDGRLLSWQNWRLRLGFNHREGLVLHQVGFVDDGRLRPVAHRMSFAEMFVPYRDASPDHYRRTAFDIGEWGLGFMTTSLELGCDCLGEITYLDAVVHDSAGEPRVIRDAICIHEEDSGVLWKHVDERTGAEVRRSRRLVVSFHVTVANYEYLVYWRFYQDGSIECEVRATGIVVTSHASDLVVNGTVVDRGTYAPFHQHFIVARLDLEVDGPLNTVYAVSSRATGVSDDDPWGLGLEVVSTPLRTEAEGKQDYDWASQRAWKVVNEGVLNGLGSPVGYKLVPSGAFPPLLPATSPAFLRAEVVGHTLWVTPYSADERWPCGDFPNLSLRDAGLPFWTAANRSIENTDVVLWYVFGIHHITRPEDWPVMPTDAVSFWLKPFGFFDRNPALDVPPGH
jgi:primary-amine oxidase